MSQTLLEGRRVTKRFGGLTAVSAVDFTVRKGEILGVIGPNGAGKTTLLNCITGLDPPDGGEILFRGERIETLKPHAITRKGVARTFQIVQPFSGLAVRDNVAMGALFGSRKSRKEVRRAQGLADEMLAFVGLSDKAAQLASQLTLAERKRLEFAKSLATEPEVLLLDEVNAGLNTREIQNAISLIHKVREQGVTILVIEHLMKVITDLSDRVIVLHHGEKIAEGAAARGDERRAGHQGVSGREVRGDDGEMERGILTVATRESGAGANLLEVRGLAGGYDDVQVLWGVDLSVREGEIVAIVGSNGVGKSTFLRMLSGVLPHRAGAITLAGESLEGMAPEAIVARGISHVPEGRRLFAAMSVEENLLMGAYARGMADSELAADLERVYGFFPRLAERKSQLAGSMSGGEQQMCAIARGLMARPRLLLIDELSLGLAPRLVEELCGFVRQINGEGVAIILVEQDVLTAFELAGRAYVFETGRVTISGTSEALLANPEVKRAYLGM